MLLSMKTFVRLFLVTIFLAAFRAAAQSVLPLSIPYEVLPPWSDYGEAVLRRDISYVSHPTTNQNFNLYLPKEKSARPFPLVVWIHGGAWLSGSKEWDNVKYLVRDGYAIASIDYRFTPEAPFPAQIQDCNAALNFILAHAADYGVDGGDVKVADIVVHQKGFIEWLCFETNSRTLMFASLMCASSSTMKLSCPTRPISRLAWRGPQP